MPVRNVAPNMEKAIRATSANPIVWLTLRLEPPSAHGDIAGHPRAVSSQRRKIDLSQQRCNRGSAREMFTRNTNITVVRQRPPRNEQWPLCSCTSTARPSKPRACRCGRSPATPVRRSGAGSSLIGLRQDRDIALTVGSAAELLPPLEQLAAVRREIGKDTTKEYALSN